LLAIADAAGGEWPRRAREIAAATVDADEAKRIGLLADIRDVFETKGVDRIKSADLAAALVAMEGHPWAEQGKSGKPLSVNSLARMLANDGISPKNIRFGDEIPKGYELEQFKDAFARYLPLPPNPTATPLQVAETLGSPAHSQPLQGNGCSGWNIPENTSVPAGCSGVAVENQERAPEDEKADDDEGRDAKSPSPDVPPKSERVRVRI
jgi:hypothetical protein